MSMRGKYIVIEGLDGLGKGTQQQLLLEKLGDSAIGVREPGGTPMAEGIRTLVKDGHLPRAARTNVYLFSAARADLIDQLVRPTIQKGQHVVSDRNWLSTIAIQTAEGVEETEELYQLCRLATKEFFEPDLLVFIDTTLENCRARMGARGTSAGDYFEQKGDRFFARQREIYLAHITRLPKYAVIDGNNSPQEVAALVQKAVAAILTPS